MSTQLELIALSPEEVSARGDELAALVQEYNRVEALQKDAAKAASDRLKELRAEMSRVAQAVSHKKEWRDGYQSSLSELRRITGEERE